jgi:hypothetical protein
VIDASTFSISYNTFWDTYTPMCELFIRRLNLGGLERIARPMAASGTSRRRPVIAEYAFSLFVEYKKDSMAGVEQRQREIAQEVAWRATEVRLAPYVVQGLNIGRAFNEEESGEVDEISRRLFRFFTKAGMPLVLRPVFAGCGFVDASEGDVILGETIYEVKTVDRPFRSIDLRQTIAYAALNSVSRQFVIKNIGLFNPRRGLFCDFELEFVCSEISGRPAEELLANIVQVISSGEISR